MKNDAYMKKLKVVYKKIKSIVYIRGTRKKKFRKHQNGQVNGQVPFLPGVQHRQKAEW